MRPIEIVSIGALFIATIVQPQADAYALSTKPKAAKKSEPPSYKLTKLICEDPIGTFEVSAKTRLKFVSVRVRNIGQFEARKVRVFVVLPNNEIRKLSGPSSIREGNAARFERSISQLIGSARKLKSYVECDNCY